MKTTASTLSDESTSSKEKPKPATRTRFMSPPVFILSDYGFKPTENPESVPPSGPPGNGNGNENRNGNANDHLLHCFCLTDLFILICLILY